jgi:transposase
MTRLPRSEISRIYHEGEEAVIALVETLHDALALLEARIAVLEGQHQKNSKNSSKPPSSDGLRRTLSLRTPSGKKPGGQADHEGQTLLRSSTPDEVVLHVAPEVCPSCQYQMSAVTPECAETRQVFDVPKVTVRVTEHQVYARICPCCQTRSKAAFPSDVKAPVQYGSRITSLAVYLNIHHLVPRERTVEILHELCGVSFSHATLDTMLMRAYAQTASTDVAIVAALIESQSISADETGARVKGHTDWIHVLSTPLLTHYHPSVYRGRDAHDETRILEEFAARGGVLHTDFYASYRSYPCLHAYCNAHLLRELRFLAEVRQQDWAQGLRTLLQEAWHTIKTERQKTETATWVLSPMMFTDLTNRFDTLVEAALLVHPRCTERAGKQTKGRIKQSQERLLLERLRDFKADILRFAENPLAAFDNNLAERDLRMIKVQQKISGSFRSYNGATVFCRLRGFCSTVRKHGANILDALLDALEGIPFQLDGLST